MSYYNPVDAVSAGFWDRDEVAEARKRAMAKRYLAKHGVLDLEHPTWVLVALYQHLRKTGKIYRNS